MKKKKKVLIHRGCILGWLEIQWLCEEQMRGKDGFKYFKYDLEIIIMLRLAGTFARLVLVNTKYAFCIWD